MCSFTVYCCIENNDFAKIMEYVENFKIDTIAKMKRDYEVGLRASRPQVSRTYSDQGRHVLETLQNQKFFHSFEGIEGEPSIMSADDIIAMEALKHEYESNCYVQCKLMPIFEEIGLCIVNSERPGFEWLEPLTGTDDCQQERPDFIVCNKSFYEPRAQPSVEQGVRAVQEQLLGSDSTLLYGVKAGHPQCFLDDIFLLEGKRGDLTEVEIGQVKKYAGLQARKLNNFAFHRLALFNCQKFFLFISRGGDFVSATECSWCAPGSKRLLQEFFDFPSPLLKAMRDSCEGLKVVPCVPKQGTPCILGAGRYGVVFRVTPVVDADLHSTSSESTVEVQQCTALKVVVGDCGDMVHLKWERDLTAAARAKSDRVVTVGPVYFGRHFGSYLIEEVGSPVRTATVEERHALFVSLYNLHILDVTHGDARVQNAIALSDGISWIDFTTRFFAVEVPVQVGEDFALLFRTVYAKKPDETAVQAYRKIVAERDALTPEALAMLGVL